MSPPVSNKRDPADGDAELRLSFGEPSRSYPIQCVLDLDEDGFVVGIEILGIAAEAGPITVPAADKMSGVGVVSISLDTEADALYVRLKPGPSPRQVVRPAVLELADDGTLVGILVRPSA